MSLRGWGTSVRWFLVDSSDQDIVNGTKRNNSLRKELNKAAKIKQHEVHRQNLK